MGLVDYISPNPQHEAVNKSAYVEQFIVAILDVTKLSAKRFLLNAENYTDFAARNPLLKHPQILRIPITKLAVNLHLEIQNILQ